MARQLRLLLYFSAFTGLTRDTDTSRRVNGRARRAPGLYRPLPA